MRRQRVFTLTPEGAAEAALQDREPWKPFVDPAGERIGPMRDALEGVVSATRAVAHSGKREQQERAVQILLDARRQLYRMLADAD